jgi:hypothetical protein
MSSTSRASLSPAGVTITLTAGYDDAPVYWLATGKVEIDGAVNLNGAAGQPGNTTDVDVRIPALAGSGGYGGGVGGNLPLQYATPGAGPGGGAVGGTTACEDSPGGNFTGNQYLIPLVGGSGAGGIYARSGFGAGGGAGGGAILIASSAQIVFANGTISANGGNGNVGCTYSGGGSGGAIRLVSNTISGTGLLTALGGLNVGYNTSASPGRVRLEANTISSTLSFTDPTTGRVTPESQSPPLNDFNSFIPTVPQPSVQVTMVNGQEITENPFSFPDILINTDQPVPVLITGHQVPVGTTATLIILGESADQDVLSCTLAGTLATSTCTIPVTYAFGGSRGLVKATWQNSGSK